MRGWRYAVDNEAVVQIIESCSVPNNHTECTERRNKYCRGEGICRKVRNFAGPLDQRIQV